MNQLTALVVDSFIPIPGYEDYAVSACGAILSMKRGKVKQMRAISTASGYRSISLCRPGARALIRLVHHIVLEAFVGNRPDGMETRHLDGNRTNNSLPNLCWGTPLENGKDRTRHGTAWGPSMKGVSNPRAKLTEGDVVQIRRMEGSCDRLAALFGVSRTLITLIRARKIWRHI